MSLLMTAFLTIFAAGCLFFVSRRLGLADPQSSAVAAIGTVFVVAALVFGRDPAPVPAPAAVAPAAPANLPVTYAIPEAKTLAPGIAGTGVVDQVVLTPAINGSFDAKKKSISARAGTAIMLQGWAVDPKALRAGKGALAFVDGRLVASGPYGADRPDVAQDYKVPEFRFSGYHVDVPTSGMSPGAHELRLVMVSPDAKHYESFGPVLRLTIAR
jgi:hypothetical protein